MELVRYIHLNPLRARLVRDMIALYKYSFSGHGVIMGKHNNNWQDTDAILRLFGEKVSDARSQYRTFVEKGIAIGKREDLIGGGLIRSHGGWANVKAMRRAKIFEKADERILGDGDFVTNVLAVAKEKMKRRYAIQAKGIKFESLVERVAEIFDMPSSENLAPGKHQWRVRAKSVLCFWANRELEISMSELSRRVNVSVMTINNAVR